jgi:hypothetical protein
LQWHLVKTRSMEYGTTRPRPFYGGFKSAGFTLATQREVSDCNNNRIVEDTMRLFKIKSPIIINLWRQK